MSTESKSDGKRQLLEAALHLFAERGFHGTSVRDLAKTAGISVALIHKHYGSKAGLSAAVDAFVLKEFERFASNFPDLEGEALLHWALDDAVRLMGERPDLYRYLCRAVLERSAASQPLIQGLYSVHKRMIEEMARGKTMQSEYDLTWRPLINMFVSLGPALFAPYIERITGRSVFDPAEIRRFKQEYLKMVHPALMTDLARSTKAPAAHEKKGEVKSNGRSKAT